MLRTPVRVEIHVSKRLSVAVHFNIGVNDVNEAGVAAVKSKLGGLATEVWTGRIKSYVHAGVDVLC